MKSYRDYNPTQSSLFPQSPTEWLSEGHLAYFVFDTVNALDLRPFTEPLQRKDARGERPYHPAMMLSLLIYGYCVGVFSSRRIAKATYDDVAFRFLSGANHPHFSRISDFRRRHFKDFRALFVEVVRICQQAGLVKLGHVALDGTKVKAKASKHKSMSYARMHKSQSQLESEIESLLEQAEAYDQQDDARYGKDHDGSEIPDELKRRQDRLLAIQKAKAELERQAQEKRAEVLGQQGRDAEDKAKKAKGKKERQRHQARAQKRQRQAEQMKSSVASSDPHENEGLSTHKSEATAQGLPKAKSQRNFSDPQSRIMESGGSFIQGYNCQLAVDGAHQIIVGQAVSNRCTDRHHFVPMLEHVEQTALAYPDKVSADAGYWAPENVEAAKERKVEAYISPQRKLKGDNAALTEAKKKMLDKLRQDGAVIYRRRKAIVEPVNGQIKRAMGFRSFSVCSLKKVSGEWSLVSLCHNLLKLYRRHRHASA